MTARRWMLVGAAAVLLLAVILIMLVLFAPGSRGIRGSFAKQAEATNLELDVRFSYDPSLLTPAPFDSRAEYPLRLDGEHFSFYGKRIRGLGKFLVKEPAPLLYDFVGSQHMESFEQWFGLELMEEPVYEDAQLGGHLGLHQLYIYRRTEKSKGWPIYFPDCVTAAGVDEDPEDNQTVSGRLAADSGADIAYIEGWALFSPNDLFFFQAVSPAKLTEEQRQACLDIMDSMQFDVLLSPSPAAESDQPAPPATENGTENGQSGN